jgi:hypothetical protein
VLAFSFTKVRIISNENYSRILATSTGMDLSETFEVPGDTQEITNFAYNAATGVVTFDYKLNISQYRAFDSSYNNAIDSNADNTTMHALTITGSVSARVHNGVVMRKSAQ